MSNALRFWMKIWHIPLLWSWSNVFLLLLMLHQTPHKIDMVCSKYLSVRLICKRMDTG